RVDDPGRNSGTLRPEANDALRDASRDPTRDGGLHSRPTRRSRGPGTLAQRRFASRLAPGRRRSDRPPRLAARRWRRTHVRNFTIGVIAPRCSVPVRVERATYQGTRSLDRRGRLRALAQHELLDLPGRRLGHHAEHHASWALEAREQGAAVLDD